MPDREAVARFVERFAAALTDAGMPRMPARVFAALLVTDSGRLTAAELAEQLQGSAGSISGAVRYLIQTQLVDREREPGSRKDHYRVRDDVWHAATVRRDDNLRRWQAALEDGIAAVGRGDACGRPARRDAGVLRLPAAGRCPRSSSVGSSTDHAGV